MTKKTAADILKGIPRRTDRPPADAFDDDDFPTYGDTDRTDPSALTCASVSQILAVTMLHATLPPKAVARISSAQSLALVVGVPGPDYVGPVARALETLREWTEVIKRSGANRSADKPSVGSDSVAACLGAGRSVTGVSTSPDRYLPTALTAVADLRIDLGPPTPRVIRAVIHLVTGRQPRSLPADIVLGLGFDEITACIRKGSRASDCVRRLKAASASKRAAGPDLADVPHLRDTFGYGAARDHGLALIDAIEAYRRGERSWASVEGRNIVLAGPPGTGKTTYARSLAKSLGVRLTATSVSSWFAQTNGYLNDICKKIDEVFMEASQNGGVLLIDEIDCLPSRERCDSRHRDYWASVIAHVLTTLDGAVSSPASKVVVIGATNFPEHLDPALVRPGRLDRIVRIELPDAEAVEGIFRQHLAGALADEDLGRVAAVCTGATGADIAGWAAAARMAAMAGRRPMALSDLLDRIAPPETRTRDELLAVARHEASHAALLTMTGLAEVRAVSIVARGGFAGRTSSRPKDLVAMTPAEFDDLIVCVLAGRAADQYWGGVTSGSAGGPASDLAQATALVASKFATWGMGGSSLLYRGDQAEAVRLLGTDPDFRRACDKDLCHLYEVSRTMVRVNSDVIDRIAHRLLDARVILGDEVRALVAEDAGGKAVRKPGEGGFHV